MANSLSVKNNSLIVRQNSLTSQITIDDFERGNLDPYSQTGGFSISSGRASQGSQSLHGASGVGNKSVVSFEGDGLNYYPSRGDTILFDVNFDTLGSDAYFGFFHGSGDVEEKAYEVHFETGNDVLRLVNDVGEDYTLGTANVNYQNDTWETCEINTDSSGTSVSFMGSTINTGHTGRDSGGILFFTGGISVYFDNVRAI